MLLNINVLVIVTSKPQLCLDNDQEEAQLSEGKMKPIESAPVSVLASSLARCFMHVQLGGDPEADPGQTGGSTFAIFLWSSCWPSLADNI